ncbi:G-protein coupled receptors family 1 profile domain-containing protein [Caenorhabditis elegans]|uniref:G-protein coupled receptors family 1 profile domain-containing protein n=1 Tax=Caenorhabditis elegans TaxID=6239 RepID=O16955_CAEEL|nr:G-protein coupled receptors family 1 profile domain-containing protein [Caenorhabditis elegans]CCD64486.1 G-protein coupled receptors family 1 profile domain-containing protein [Caenorhabditis elegans]|eukprot:NP_503232.2 Serpentine Receptor, class W [Caenorhabditis elegans]
MNSEVEPDFVQSFQNVLSLLEDDAFLVNFILACISLIANIFHFVVITRKSMRISSVNVLMIGVSICNIFRMLTAIYRYLELVDLEYPECITSDSYLKMYFDIISWWLQDYFRRCSSWMEIFIATARLIIMRDMSSARNTNAAKPKLGVILMLLVFFASGAVQGIWLYTVKVVENQAHSLYSNCAEHQDVIKVSRFILDLRPESNYGKLVLIRTYFILDVICSHFLPSLALPILTLFLLREMRIIKQSRSTLQRSGVVVDNEEKYGLPTKLIALLTITSFLADTPLGCIGIAKAFIQQGTKLMRFLTDLIVYFNILTTAMTIFHPVMCLLMSSQYRITARKLLRIKKKSASFSAGNNASIFPVSGNF